MLLRIILILLIEVVLLLMLESVVYTRTKKATKEALKEYFEEKEK